MSTTTSTWSCAQCSSTFDKSKLLERHALQSSHKAYKCTQCAKTFGKRTALIRHNTTHSNVKAHACRVCGKAFHRKDHCAEHEEVCIHRLAVETKARLSASLVGSSSSSKKYATSETTSRGYPQEQSIDHAAGSRKRYREENGDGDQLQPVPLASMNDLSYSARLKPQQSIKSDPETRRLSDGLIGDFFPEVLLQQYPALKDIHWRWVPSDEALATDSTELNDPQRSIVDSAPNFPAHLVSMAPSVREASPLSTPNFGTCACTYHGCMQRFDSLADLQGHKREFHRAPPVDKNVPPANKFPWTRIPRILIIEERPIWERVIADNLHDLHCSVDALDRRAAKNALLSHRTFDLILMVVDHRHKASSIPSMDRIPELTSVPIIMVVTTYLRSEDISMYVQHGASDILRHPLEKEEVSMLLDKHLPHLRKNSCPR